MFPPLHLLLVFIYPSSPPLHFAPSSPLTCILLSSSINVLQVKGRHLGREGVAVQGSAEAYNLLFRPNLSYPQPSFLSCILSLFHSPFCLRRGMNFNHCALHLQAQTRPGFFFPPSISSVWRLKRFLAIILSINASSCSSSMKQIHPLQGKKKQKTRKYTFNNVKHSPLRS